MQNFFVNGSHLQLYCAVRTQMCLTPAKLATLLITDFNSIKWFQLLYKAYAIFCFNLRRDISYAVTVLRLSALALDSEGEETIKKIPNSDQFHGRCPREKILIQILHSTRQSSFIFAKIPKILCSSYMLLVVGSTSIN